MAPEYSKAAKNLNPMIPFYAVDCDENKSLCAEQVTSPSFSPLEPYSFVYFLQGVEGFPTVKVWGFN